jgi:hypothetical protein
MSTAPVTSPNPLAAEDELEEPAPRIELTPRKVSVFALFVVLSIVALYLLLPQLAGLEDTWHRIEEGSPYWLAVALFSAIGMFTGYVALFQGIYGRVSGRLTYRESYQITMASLAATRLFSAGGAGGIVLTAWALRRAGIPRLTVADTTISFIVVTYLVYTIALTVGGFGLHFGILPGPDPFAITFVPALLALLVTAVGLSVAFVPPDLQNRMRSWCQQGPSRIRRWGVKAAHDLGRHARRSETRARTRPRPLRRGALLGVSDPLPVGVLPGLRPLARRRGARRRVLRGHAREPAPAARRHRRRGRRHDRRVRRVRRRLRPGGRGGPRLPRLHVLAAHDPGRHRVRAAAPDRRALEAGTQGRRSARVRKPPGAGPKLEAWPTTSSR